MCWQASTVPVSPAWALEGSNSCDLSQGALTGSRKFKEHVNIVINSLSSRDFLGGPVVKTLHFQCRGVQVLSLVGELASHMLLREVKKKKKKLVLQNLASKSSSTPSSDFEPWFNFYGAISSSMK